MILKTKDDTQQTISQLQEWIDQGDLPTATRTKIVRELAALRRGSQGEKQCAFHLDGVIKDHPKRIIIHDLRLEHDGEVAQIDHLMINCLMEFWLLESKSYLNGFRISDRGEFEYWSGNRYHAMASPIEQVKRQARILERILKDHDLAPTGFFRTKKPVIRTAVLVDPTTRVKRPNKDTFNTDMVIKADAFITEYEKQRDQMGAVEVFSALTRLVKKDDIIAIGRKLVAMHAPLAIDYRKKFGLDRLAARVAEEAEAYTAEAPAQATADVAEPPAATQHEQQPPAPESPPCPRCGKTMLLRTGTRGKNAGKQFWGCPGYPRCRGMIASTPQVPDAGAPQAVPDSDSKPTSAAPPPADDSPQAEPATPGCPRCGASTVLRTAKRGEQSGNRFWGCSRFPTCRGVVTINDEDLARAEPT